MKNRSRVKPKSALVGRPSGPVMAGMAWNDWKTSACASTRITPPGDTPGAMPGTTWNRPTETAGRAERESTDGGAELRHPTAESIKTGIRKPSPGDRGWDRRQDDRTLLRAG